uniref:DUF148 domain-containing protein n=1 Tax=Caenorhabditis japonica TaxID=281687 RepID=A0A8R1EC69_CAEJA
MTISDYETAVNAWAAKYQLTAEVEAFNERAVNASVSAEEHANTVVMSLPNVLTNIKAIGSDKNQTLAQMHARIIEYIDSLHEDVKEIVVVLFTSMLPPEFKQSSCKGNFFTNAYNQFFGGQNNGGNNGGFWAGGNGPRIGTTLNLQNGNNASGNGANAGLDGTAHIQILPIGMESDSQVKLAVETESAVTKHKKLQQARNKKNQNKKKKTTTTASPLVDPNPEVNTQVL